MIFDIPNVCGFRAKALPCPENGADTIAMAEEFACVIYAIETNNQPETACNWRRSKAHFRLKSLKN